MPDVAQAGKMLNRNVCSCNQHKPPHT